jgi:hypothetical protein
LSVVHWPRAGYIFLFLRTVLLLPRPKCRPARPMCVPNRFPPRIGCRCLTSCPMLDPALPTSRPLSFISPLAVLAFRWAMAPADERARTIPITATLRTCSTFCLINPIRGKNSAQRRPQRSCNQRARRNLPVTDCRPGPTYSFKPKVCPASGRFYLSSWLGLLDRGYLTGGNLSYQMPSSVAKNT